MMGEGRDYIFLFFHHNAATANKMTRKTFSNSTGCSLHQDIVS
ncbi:MAG TPA: hypothetical protein PKA53_06255 [Sphingobacterium sp.]|nr:hypothetical protein [Sphingobacterium sp.]